MNAIVKLIQTIEPRYYHLNPPANDQMIRECENALNLRLPQDYAEFLKFANGAELPLSHELFGTVEIDAGIGNLSESRTFPIAKGLPPDFLLFHDDGMDSHAFHVESSSEYSIRRIIQWDAKAEKIVKEFAELAGWLDSYISPAIKFHDQ